MMKVVFMFLCVVVGVMYMLVVVDGMLVCCDVYIDVIKIVVGGWYLDFGGGFY